MLSSTERQQARRLMLLIAATGLIETVGLTSVLPFLAVLAKPDVVQSSQTLSFIYNKFGFSETRQFMFFLGSLMLIVLIVTNALNAWTSWRCLRFSMNVGHGLSTRLLNSYLHQPYVFYLNENSSKILVDVAGRVFDLVHGAIAPAFQIVSKSVLAVFIFVLVFVVNPLLSLIVGTVVFGGYSLAYLAIRSKVKSYGAVSTVANEQRVRIATETFSGIKDLKVLGREAFFEKRYFMASAEYTKFQARNNFVGMVPRYVLEIVAFGSMIGAVLFFLSSGHDLAGILPVLVLYAFAAYRLMPSLQQIYQSAALIKFSGPSIEILHTAVKKVAASPISVSRSGDGSVNVSQLKFENQVVFEGVTYSYPDAAGPVVKGLNFLISKNTSVGLVGTTGAGKSTVLDLVLGLLEPTSGRIVVDGAALQTKNYPAWRSRIGYVPQVIYLADDTIARNIAFGLEEAEVDMSKVMDAARLARIHDFISQLPRGYATIVGERGVRLSGGQRQRIGIARALYHNPELLVFDEATSALDTATEAAIVDELEVLSGKVTMLIVAHRITTVKGCDAILLLEDGAVVDRGTYAELYERSAQFRALAA